MLSRPFGLWTKIRSRYHVRCSRIIFCLLLLHIIIQRNGLIPTAPVLRPHLRTISAKCVTFLQDWEFINAYFRQNYLFFVGDLAAYNEGNDIPASAVVSPRRLIIYNVAHPLPFRISSLSEPPPSIARDDFEMVLTLAFALNFLLHFAEDSSLDTLDPLHFGQHHPWLSSRWNALGHFYELKIITLRNVFFVGNAQILSWASY